MTYAEQNKKAFNDFSLEYQKEFLKGDIRNWSSLLHGSKIKCVSCGGKVNSLVCKYFNFEMDKVQCYSCQSSNK